MKTQTNQNQDQIKSKLKQKYPAKIHAEDVALLSTFSEVQLKNISLKGYIPAPQVRNFDFVETIHGLFKYLRETYRRMDEESKSVTERREKAKLRFELVKAAQAEGKVIPIEEICTAIIAQNNAVNTALGIMANELPAKIAGMSVDEIRKKMKEEHEKLCRQLQEYARQYIEKQQAIEHEGAQVDTA